MDTVTGNILDVANKFLVTSPELIIKTNKNSNTSSTFLRSLDTLATYATNQSTKRQKNFRKRNIALTIQNYINNSFTFIAKNKSSFLDIQTTDGEATNQISLATFFVPQSLLTRVNSTQVYSYIYRSGLLFSQSIDNEPIQSIIMAVTIPERKISNLQEPVIISFQDQNANKAKSDKTSTCKFWMTNKNGISAVSNSVVFSMLVFFYEEN